MASENLVRRQIKAALALAGVSGAAIARGLNVSRYAVYRVTSLRGKNSRVEAALIQMGIPAETFRPAKRPGRPRKQQ